MGREFYNVDQQFYREELDWLEEKIKAYREGTYNTDQMDELRKSFGIYRQRDHASYMFRLKIPGGHLTAHWLDVVADMAEIYGQSEAHVTTRQDIQLHYVPLEVTPKLLRTIFEETGMVNKGACGDGARNVKSDYLAGVDPDEVFNPLPYALALSDFFCYHPFNLNLGRKFKSSLTGSTKDQAQTRIDCLGFQARRRDGQKGWKVIAGGGLGSTPHDPRTLFDFVPVEDTLLVADAVFTIFHRLGDRSNRQRARLKFVVDELGEQGFRETIQEEIKRLRKEKDHAGELSRRLDDHDLHEPEPGTPIPEVAKQSDRLFPDHDRARGWLEHQVFDQTQDGYGAVLVFLPLGDMDPAQMRTLADLTREHGNGTARTTAQQHLCLPWIDWESVPEVYRTLESIGLNEYGQEHTYDVTACYAENCKLAVVGARQLARITQRRLVDEFGTRVMEEDVRVRIDGCFNSCGQHQIADIGFTGVQVKNPSDEGPPRFPYYNLTVGGGEGSRFRLGEKFTGKVPMEGVPDTCVALIEDYLNWRSNGEPFQQYVDQRGTDHVEGVVAEACDYLEPGASL